MKFLITILLSFFVALSFPPCQLRSDEPGFEIQVKGFIETIKSRDRSAIAKRVVYPLHRKVPLSTIRTPEQFLRHFDEILDEQLLKAISDSRVTEDWGAVGSRGIMFGSGTLWLDEHGKILAVNYQTEKGMNERARLIKSARRNLYPSIRQFLEPVLEWKTRDYRIRIDLIGENRYRYAVWPVGKTTAEKPDLILNDGEIVYDGSGGNHHYAFKKGAYLYRCDVHVIGPDNMLPGNLTVYRNNTIIVSQPVLEVIKGRR